MNALCLRAYDLMKNGHHPTGAKHSLLPIPSCSMDFCSVTGADFLCHSLVLDV
jgi:hypothetical protein